MIRATLPMLLIGLSLPQAEALPLGTAPAATDPATRLVQHHHGGGSHHAGRAAPMMELFRQADADGDGAVTQEEVDAFISSTLQNGDANGNGTVSLDEFKAIWVVLMERMIVDRFQSMDEDGDGEISRAEVDEKFGAIVERMDRDGDGRLTRTDRRHEMRRGEDGRRSERRAARGEDGRGPQARRPEPPSFSDIAPEERRALMDEHRARQAERRAERDEYRARMQERRARREERRAREEAAEAAADQGGAQAPATAN